MCIQLKNTDQYSVLVSGALFHKEYGHFKWLSLDMAIITESYILISKTI